jgi:hypothetical protein
MDARAEALKRGFSATAVVEKATSTMQPHAIADIYCLRVEVSLLSPCRGFKGCRFAIVERSDVLAAVNPDRTELRRRSPLNSGRRLDPCFVLR